MTSLVLLLLAETVVMDERLTAMAERIIAENRLPITVAVVVHEPWREQGIVNAEAFVNPARTAILVSPLLAEDMYGEGELGMLAHELAHTYVPCPDTLSYADGQACEARTDALSARWVGKRAAIMGLCQMMFSAWNRRAITDVSHLLARIRKLHVLAEGSSP